MPLLTLCHVVRTSGLLGPERVTQALKIILTGAEQKETAMHVALYARVSTSQQEKTDTIESQLEALQAYVAVSDHTVLPEHLFLDNGGSGSR